MPMKIHPYQRAVSEHARLDAMLKSVSVASSPDGAGAMSPTVYDYLCRRRESVRKIMDDTRLDFEDYFAEGA